MLTPSIRFTQQLTAHPAALGTCMTPEELEHLTCYSFWAVTLEVSHSQGIENETVKILGKPYSAEIVFPVDQN